MTRAPGPAIHGPASLGDGDSTARVSFVVRSYRVAQSAPKSK